MRPPRAALPAGDSSCKWERRWPRRFLQKGLAPALDLNYCITMTTGSETSVLAKLLRPLSHGLTAELARAIINLQADDELQARYDELAGKRTEGQLTPDEQEELQAMVQANTLLGLLKAEAHTLLAQSKAF